MSLSASVLNWIGVLGCLSGLIIIQFLLCGKVSRSHVVGGRGRCVGVVGWLVGCNSVLM